MVDVGALCAIAFTSFVVAWVKHNAELQFTAAIAAPVYCASAGRMVLSAICFHRVLVNTLDKGCKFCRALQSYQPLLRGWRRCWTARATTVGVDGARARPWRRRGRRVGYWMGHHESICCAVCEGIAAGVHLLGESGAIQWRHRREESGCRKSLVAKARKKQSRWWAVCDIGVVS